IVFFFSSRRRHTRFDCDWSSDVCSSDLQGQRAQNGEIEVEIGGGRGLRWLGGGAALEGSEQEREQHQAGEAQRAGGGEARQRSRSEERRVGKESKYQRGRDT